MSGVIFLPCQSMKTIREEGGDGKGKALEMLMEATDESGNGLTDREIEDNILILLAAGYDTTAVTTMSALYELQQNKEVNPDLKYLLKLNYESGLVKGTNDMLNIK